MADQHYKHGTMNIEVQEKTFASFISMTAKACVVIVAMIVLSLAFFG
ncbi:MAG: aa3-type cytochrome c oxidase subunit IV [Pseudomonadota bacterium]